MRDRDGTGLGRRAAAGVVLAAALAGLAMPGGAVAAGPSATPTPGSGTAGPGTPECQVRDRRLNEISGMVATDAGYVVVNDSADEESHLRIFFLDSRCAVVRAVPYPSRPLDTEDLAIGPDGTVWVADIGDNQRTRQTIAMWKLPPGAKRPTLHRMTYPDGPHDAEALLVGRDGRPVIVTKGSPRLYAPAAPLRQGGTTALAKVGQVRLPDTATSNPFSVLGRRLVTGGATAPDGRRVVLRTYADAFEFDVSDGDVVAALTTGTPRVTPLPDEPQGESITYSRDGRSLLTVSERTAGVPPVVLRYTPTPGASPSTDAATATPTPASADRAAGRTADRRDGLGVLPSAVLGVAVAGLGLVAVGLVRSARGRRTRR